MTDEQPNDDATGDNGDGDDAEDVRKMISGMHRARAPPTFAQDVTATIRKRSAGRFFARRTLGDRVPFGVLLIVALLGLLVIAWALWSSDTGSLVGDHGSAAAPAGSDEPLLKP